MIYSGYFFFSVLGSKENARHALQVRLLFEKRLYLNETREFFLKEKISARNRILSFVWLLGKAGESKMSEFHFRLLSLRLS
jgi:hypothetical protein